MPDYKTNDPRGWCGDPKRGAAMGRATIHDAPRDFAGKLALRRVYLSGDYDRLGTYWGGGGDPLFWYADEEGQIDAVIRVKDREAAKVEIGKTYPSATFEEDLDLDAFGRAYVECALWSSVVDGEDGEEHLDRNYGIADISDETMAKIAEECAAFQRDNAADLKLAAGLGEYADKKYTVEERAGHDFWLTRNGHGCGFWDRGLDGKIHS